MLNVWTIIGFALTYVGLLVAVAGFGDRNANARRSNWLRPLIYSLSLAVYCSSWAFFGSVGVAAGSGFDFLPFFIGPFIVLVAGWPVLRIIVDVSKRQNITSIADFISTRYGRSRALGGIVALIAVIAGVPYIALQLKAVALALVTILPQLGQPPVANGMMAIPNSVVIALTVAMTGFSIVFGTRHIDTTEHQHGLMHAIAVQSVFKLLAFITVGVLIMFALIGGVGPMLDIVSQRTDIESTFFDASDGDRWLTMTLLSAFAILLLPQQFHVAVVENENVNDIRRAAFLLPLYLFLMALFVVPISIAGLYAFQVGATDPDIFVLALPVLQTNPELILLVFLGGLSAATAMIIVEAVVLSLMVCNHIVVPLFLSKYGAGEYLYSDMGRTLITVRRGAMIVIMALAYGYYLVVGSGASLSQTGLLSFAAVAQFAPAVFGGMMWRRGTARGAIAGLIAGFVVWGYTLLLPSFADAGWIAKSFVQNGPFGLSALRPTVMLNLVFDPLAHGVFWSLFANISIYVGVSFLTKLSPVERLQASAFMSADLVTIPSFRLWRSTITVEQLKSAVARYVGRDRTQHAFEQFASQQQTALDPHDAADSHLFRYAEQLLSSVVGAASARLVLALMLERQSGNPRGSMRLLDDATAAIQYNRDLLQSAIDHVRQGIAVFDGNLSLICWNRQFRGLLNLPEDLAQVGIPLDEIVTAVFNNAITDERDPELAMADRLAKLTEDFQPYQERIATDGTVLEVRSSQMPDGGIVVTFADITERVLAAEALEQRVEERTVKLTELNEALSGAKAAADAANLGKTRFIAAASHDILQPLNAARLFTSSLIERQSQSGDLQLVENVDASLEAVEEILSALLDISRLDAGAMQPDLTAFSIGDILDALALEYAPAASAKGLDLRVVPCTAIVKTDRRLLRRILQNLLSNAIKYTDEGRILMGCRRQDGQLRIQVHDTGVGIAEQNRMAVFKEFERLNPPGNQEGGLGLGLAIVERIAKILGCEVKLRSEPGVGTEFSLFVPLGEISVADKPAAVGTKSTSKSISGYTVLAIDNEQPILDGMETLLTGWGCTVHTASKEDQALNIVRAPDKSIDIVLADYHLSDNKDGLGLIEELRTAAKRNLPAVLITADRTHEVQDRAAGMNVIYMRKPVKPANLRASMARAMASQEAAE